MSIREIWKFGLLGRVVFGALVLPSLILPCAADEIDLSGIQISVEHGLTKTDVFGDLDVGVRLVNQLDGDLSSIDYQCFAMIDGNAVGETQGHEFNVHAKATVFSTSTMEVTGKNYDQLDCRITGATR